MNQPDYWTKACRYLAAKDDVLARIIGNYKGEVMQTRGDGFQTLARSIIGQQISVKAADSLWAKLIKRFSTIDADTMYCADFDDLRGCGLSRQKSRYMHNIAEFARNCDWSELHTMPEDDVRDRLLDIPGVGQWTWEMFAIFYLQLPDVLPVGDVGLVNACKKHYQHQSREAVVVYAELWRPYRTVATWFLWRSLDPVAVTY